FGRADISIIVNQISPFLCCTKFNTLWQLHSFITLLAMSVVRLDNSFNRSSSIRVMWEFDHLVSTRLG
ncbi:hypothetical protein Hamer_G025655, partial [Homarus americanus]